MTGRPFLQTQFENRAWRSLNGGGPLGRFSASNGAVKIVMDDLESHEGKVGSALLISLMDHLVEETGADYGSLSKIALKSRARDCMASVHAAGIMLDKGDINAARELLSISSGSHEVLNRSLMAARICRADGDLSGVKANALAAYNADPGCMDAYKLLEMVDPEGGWAQRANIQDVLSGRRPESQAGEGRLQLLFKIYYEWFRGNRESATDLMVRSRHQSESDPDFILASARMSVDEKDWRSAAMMYSKILDGAPPFIIREAAEAELAGGNAHRALELLRSTDQTHPATMRALVSTYSALGDRSEMMDALRSYLDSEWAGTDEWVRATSMLLDLGMESEASGILSMYTAGMGWDASAFTVQSQIRMSAGEYPAAYMSASNAVRMDRDSRSARLQLARILCEMGNTVRAERECDRILAEDGDCRDALILMRDICMKSGDGQRAVGVCRRILECDQSDPRAMMDLADALLFAGHAGDGVKMWNSALRCDRSCGSYIRAASSMISSKLYSDAVLVCKSGEASYPHDKMLKRLRGNAEYMLEEYLKASVAFADALREDPNDPVLWYSKGMSDECRTDLDAAEASYRRAMALDDKTPEYPESLAVILEAKGDDEGAVAYLNIAIALDPMSPYPICRKAGIFARSGKRMEAMGLLDMALASDPTHQGSLELLLSLQHALARYDDALTTFLRMGSPSDDAVLLAADCYAVKNMKQEAVALLNDRTAKGGGPAIAEAAARYEGAEPVRQECTRIFLDREPETPSKTSGPPESDMEPPATCRVENGDDLCAMAVSLSDAGDLDGAMAAINRALAQDPDNQSYQAIKAELAYRSGDYDAALFMASSALKVSPGNPKLHMTVGRIRAAKGDFRGAIQAYEAAQSCGMDDADLFVAKGDAYNGIDSIDRAMECYASAVSRNPDLLDVSEHLAVMMLSCGELAAADGVVSKVICRDPSRLSAIMLKADIAHARKDRDGMMDAYALYMKCGTQTSDANVTLARMMEDMGCTAEARALVGGNPGRSAGDPVKRYAEKALRRAFTTKTPPTDPDVMGYLGLDPAMSSKVLAYLSERRDAGPIVPGTDEFREMERRSLDVVTKMKWTHLEQDPELPLDAVFVQCGFKDVDSAKDMVAYIRRAMLSDVGRKADPRLVDMSLGLPKGMTIYEIMQECAIGVYEARVVQSQII